MVRTLGLTRKLSVSAIIIVTVPKADSFCYVGGKES